MKAAARVLLWLLLVPLVVVESIEAVAGWAAVRLIGFAERIIEFIDPDGKS